MSKLQERIANIYYRHGLFCARHPVAVICLSLIVISFSCYPLIYLPIFKSAFYFKTPPFQPPSSSSQHWFQEGPVAYILQVVLKSSVLPWQEDLKFQDAFRGPLAQVFSLEETILNHQLQAENGSLINLAQLCLQVSEPLRFASILPHYGCLMVSPSQLWKNDISKFQQDGDIVRTIFTNPDPKLDSSNIKEILFGVPWKETGIKRFNVRTRSRVLTYAVTVVLKDFNIDFLRSLRRELSRKYPHGLQSSLAYNEADLSFLHFNNQAQDSAHLVQYLALTYLAAFFYIYFSVCKMDLVEWKLLMALSAVATLILTLLMAVGLCLWFGLLPSTWQPIGLRCDLNDVLPYMVVVVGLENHFIITKSVISTPTHIDLKLRVAQGLSKEGYSITKHFAMEVVLLLAAFCTCMPTVQEFCQVAFVGIISDFFLQMVFFTTLLSTNLKKIEPLDPYRHHHKTVPNLAVAAESSKQEQPQLYTTPVLSLSRTMLSKIRRNGWSHYSRSSAPILVTVPKRLRFVYFWARTRMVQRFLMLCLICWIIWLLYISGFAEHLNLNMGLFSSALSVLKPLLKLRVGHGDKGETDLNGTLLLNHRDPELWRQLPPQHWSTLLGLYNISLLGRSVSILPPLLLSAPVSPSLHHSSPQLPADLDEEEGPGDELYLTLVFSIPTMCLIVYVMVVLYRCMCTRHYAEWRTSWSSHRPKPAPTSLPFPHLDNYVVMEAPPISLPNHSHELEELASHGNLVVSTCLTGDVLVWDSRSGECINLIVRNQREAEDKGGGTKAATSPGSQPPSVISSTSHFPASAGYDFGPFYGSSQDSLLTLVSKSQPQEPVEESRVHHSFLPFQPVWCLDCQEWLCVLGCAQGRIEVWNGYTGELLCHYSENAVGVTAIRLIGRRIILTRLDGGLEFFHLKDSLVTGGGAADHHQQEPCGLLRLHNLKPHNQPISCLLVHKGCVVITGSQDHLIKVFKYETVTCLFTLHGHIGGITTLHIDHEQGTVVSGCAGGRLCTWDLGTGTCVYSLQGHSGPVTGLDTTSMYLVSSSPTQICIWEKSQGHLLHSIRKERNFCNDFVLLTPNVMVTARENQLLVWDVNHGEALRIILLPQRDQSITRLCQWGQTLGVTFSSQLFLIHFSSGASEKTD